MSTDNLVVGELSLVDGRVPEYVIYIACDGQSYDYRSKIESGLEVWEHDGVFICLEDYR